MENNWQKRTTTILKCPSGNEVEVRRTGPDLAVKAGKFARVLQKVGEGTPQEQLEKITNLSDPELEELMAFARIVLADIAVNPKLYLNPVGDQLSPDDLPLGDFWFMQTWAMSGGPTMPVALKEGETDIESVNNFPEQSGSGNSAGVDSEAVQ